MTEPLPFEDSTQVALSDLLNRVLDKGLVIVGSVTISVADVDLVKLDLTVMMAAVQSVVERQQRALDEAASNADVPLLPGE